MIATTTCLQKSFSLSTTDAEYVAIPEPAKMIVWRRYVLNELGLHKQSTRVHQDNTGCISWASSRMSKHRKNRRHIDVRHNYIMQLVRVGFIKLVPKRMTDMKADFDLNFASWRTETRNFSGGNI